MKIHLKYLFVLLLPSAYVQSIEIDATLDEAEWENAIVINEYFETNKSDHTVSKIFNFFSNFKILKEYFTYNIYCILRNV